MQAHPWLLVHLVTNELLPNPPTPACRGLLPPRSLGGVYKFRWSALNTEALAPRSTPCAAPFTPGCIDLAAVLSQSSRIRSSESSIGLEQLEPQGTPESSIPP